MVFIKECSEANDKGTLFTIAIDPDTNLPVKARIRRIPGPKARSIEQKYGNNERVTTEYERDGVKGQVHLKQRVNTTEEMRCIRRDKAIFAWVDCEGFQIQAEDEDQAKRYSKLIGDSSIVAGVPVTLDGRLNDEIKHYLLENSDDLATAILTKANELDENKAIKEASQRKN